MSVRLRLVDREPGLDLGVGAVVVYGSHGLGRVIAQGPKNGGDEQGAPVVLEFPSGLSVILPRDRAEACLRPLAGATELESVRAALRSRDAPTEQSWQVRTQTTRTKIALGDLVGLAEVVRDAVERQRRVAAPSKVSLAEQQLYRKARGLLIAEIAVAAGIDEDQAETWIENQLGADDE